MSAVAANRKGCPMAEAADPTVQIQTWLDRMQAGDSAARDELLGYACDRLRLLTRKMLKGFDRVKRWEQTDDVFQNALLRLWTALEQVQPRSVQAFFGLAALQIRRELIDLARQYYGPEGAGAHHASQGAEDSSSCTPPAGCEQQDTTYEPSRLAIWSEFHRQVDALPAEERQVFDLVWYQGLPQPRAAALLGVSEATLKRRWWSARQRLHGALKGQLPGCS
jgi:RNA polymerase sigma factor (sigma-70 family)